MIIIINMTINIILVIVIMIVKMMIIIIINSLRKAKYIGTGGAKCS
jgi:hypothetical protein